MKNIWAILISVSIVWIFLVLISLWYNSNTIPTMCCGIEKNKCGVECLPPLYYYFIALIPSIIIIIIAILINKKSK
jgi:hypothetical protein